MHWAVIVFLLLLISLPKLSKKYLADGIDQTEYLQGLGIPLAPHLSATKDAW